MIRSIVCALSIGAALALVGCTEEVVDEESCPEPRTLCAEVCVDTNVDGQNCGGCDAVCEPGEVCNGAGACELTCQRGWLTCDGTCIDPNTNSDYCGASDDCAGELGGTGCGAGEVCNGGVCELSCQAGLTECDGTCVDTMTDRRHCGGCGETYACDDGEVCDGEGGCELSCQAGLTECDGTCVDTMTDRRHCGGCGETYACGDGEVCDGAGVCELSCQAGLTECDGTCVDTMTDRRHCGGCGETYACGDGEVCDGAGGCELSCQVGLTECDGTCVDTMTDHRHCGGCGEAYACTDGEVCDGAGACEACPSGFTGCDGACIDTAADADHCGDCGNSCDAPIGGVGICVASSCDVACPSGQSLVTAYIDVDGDTYTAGEVTLCSGPTLPDGYAESPSDTVDCCDTDLESFPGAGGDTRDWVGTFPDTPNACGSWDWNCDGRITKGRGTCASLTGCSCSGPECGSDCGISPPYWTATQTKAECGATGERTTCTMQVLRRDSCGPQAYYTDINFLSGTNMCVDTDYRGGCYSATAGTSFSATCGCR